MRNRLQRYLHPDIQLRKGRRGGRYRLCRSYPRGLLDLIQRLQVLERVADRRLGDASCDAKQMRVRGEEGRRSDRIRPFQPFVLH